jgi:hypothetical protein
MAGLRQNNTSEIEVRGSMDSIYNKLLESAQAVGKIKQESKQLGAISVRTSMKLFPPTNAVNLRITLKSKDQETCLISFNADSLDGVAGFGSPGKIIDKLIKELSDRI